VPKPLPADTWSNLFYPDPGYKYFENSDRFPFEPDAREFSWKNAWWLADAAVLAYVKDWDSVKGFLEGAGFSKIVQFGTDPRKSTKGFFASSGTPSPYAIIAFRGTDKDDPRNAVTDADTLPLERDGYVVHKGFVQALDEVWDDEVKPLLDDFQRGNPTAPVYFTGHSLGAALATIAVTRFNGICPLYTIGSPRVGDERFVSAVLNKTNAIFRFVNSQDIVTQIPPEVALQSYFRHVGIEKYIDRNGVIHDHPSEFDKAIDVGLGIIAHGGAGALSAIGQPAVFLSNARKTLPLVDPPPYIVGSHSPNRYPVHIWNQYSHL
jgi:triacylglycerol lipase